jgi:hypothetical protein
MSNETSDRGKTTFKRKRKDARGNRAKTDAEAGTSGSVMDLDQLEWNKVSLQHDEYDDFEEIEGVDVEYVHEGGNKLIQFKVYPSLVSNIRLWTRQKGRPRKRNLASQPKVPRTPHWKKSGRE